MRSGDLRGRRVLLWGAACFFAIQFLGGLVLDHSWPELRFPTAGVRFRSWQTSQPAADIIFLGSSRFGGIDAAAIDQGFQDVHFGRSVQAFNASIEAGDLVTAEYMLRELGRRGAAPRLVVVEISPETVTRHNRWILEHIRRQVTWQDVPRFFADACVEGQFGRLLQARLLPLYMHRREILRQTSQALAGLTTRQPAWEKKADVEIKLGQAPLTPGQLHTTLGLGEVPRWLRHYQAGGGVSEQALERLLTHCRQRGIQVILVGVPVTTAHRQFYTPQIEAQFRGHIDRWLRDFGCAFVDYRDRVPDRLFVDHHHPSTEGGAYFSRLLAREALAPRWNNYGNWRAGRH